MEAQSQIKRTLSQPQSIDSIRRLLDDGSHASRSSFAQAACSHFGFFDARGHAQSAGCIKALRELEQAARLPTVMQATGLGRSTIYRLVASGTFPAPVHLGPRAGRLALGGPRPVE